VGIPGHIITSVAASGIAFGVTGSISLSLGVAIGSLMLDVDHFLDYFVIDNQRSVSPKRFLLYYSNCFPLRRVLLLHSWELLVLLLGFAFLVESKAVASFVLGAFIHLIADLAPQSDLSLCSRIKLYSFIYRWHHGFNSSKLYCWVERS
jgi:hypothetical protein